MKARNERGEHVLMDDDMDFYIEIILDKMEENN